ncbi:MAG: 50S ribosomal protein L9 [Saprospiraceae bacterium]
MDIILLENINKVGDKHEVVNVKDGYARNFLIPNGKALIANPSNRKRLTHLLELDEAREGARLTEYQAMAEKLKDQSLSIPMKAGANGKIFGSVTNVQIAQALREQFEVDLERRKIEVTEEVKTLGKYTATLNLHKEVTTEIAFEVVED